MSKRKWLGHPAVGLTISVDGVQSLIVDAKCGPMHFNRSDLALTDVVFHGTIALRVRPEGGKAERWLPPVDGEKIVAWAENERAKGKTHG